MNLYHVADPTTGDDGWAATKGYADKHLKLTGGSLTGNLILESGSGLTPGEIIKSTRNTGYAFQVKPDDGDDATAFIHTNGSASFGTTSFTGVISFSGDARIKAYDSNGQETYKLYPSGLREILKVKSGLIVQVLSKVL